MSIKKCRSINNIKAFSITELSIVMLIIGVLLAGSLSVALYQTDSVKEQQTLQKMKIIEEAIVAYVSLNRRLPCPADASLNIENLASLAYANENFSGTNCAGSLTYQASTNLPSTTPALTDTYIAVGSVPTNTLKLPRELILDGWGHKFTYVVSRGLANNITNAFDSQEEGVIKVFNFSNPGGTQYATNRAAYLILSHGKSGAGSWPKNGGSRTASGADTKKSENSHTSGAYNESFILNIPNSSGSTFDDIIKYKNKEQILLSLNLTHSGNVCNVTYNSALIDAVQTNPSLQLCNGTGGVGNIPSSADCSIYLINIAEIIRERCLKR